MGKLDKMKINNFYFKYKDRYMDISNNFIIYENYKNEVNIIKILKKKYIFSKLFIQEKYRKITLFKELDVFIKISIDYGEKFYIFYKKNLRHLDLNLNIDNKMDMFYESKSFYTYLLKKTDYLNIYRLDNLKKVNFEFLEPNDKITMFREYTYFLSIKLNHIDNCQIYNNKTWERIEFKELKPTDKISFFNQFKYHFLIYINNKYYWIYNNKTLKLARFQNDSNNIITNFNEYSHFMEIIFNNSYTLIYDSISYKKINLNIKFKKIKHCKQYNNYMKLRIGYYYHIFRTKNFKKINFDHKIEDFTEYTNFLAIKYKDCLTIYNSKTLAKISFNSLKEQDKIIDFSEFKNFLRLEINHNGYYLIYNKFNLRLIKFKGVKDYYKITYIDEFKYFIKIQIFKKNYIIYDLKFNELINSFHYIQ